MTGVIYARYSSDNQREESIEGQLRECNAFAQRNDIQIVGTYIDRAFSARTDNRPDFQRMIKDSANGSFDTVIVWKLDRFARNRYDSALYKSFLRKNGVKVISATVVIADTAEGILLESLLEGLAEYYSADLAEKVIRGLTENALKCKFNGGTLPLGYTIDSEQHFQIDPLTAPAVLEAFKRYAEGISMTEIAEEMNAKGLRSVFGGRIGVDMVTRMLKNRRYIGEYKYRDIVHPHGIPAIIPQELFDSVQRRMATNKKAPAKHKAEDEYLLTTKLRCGKCDRFMVGESGKSKNSTVYRYYKCVGVKQHKGCDKKTVRKDWIEDFVVKQIEKVLSDDALLENIADTIMEIQSRENTVLPMLRKQYADLQRGIDNLLNAIQQGIVTPSTKQRLEDLENQMSDISVQIIKEEMSKPLLTKNQILFWFHRFRKYNTHRLDHKRRLIDSFINAIYLYDDKMVITFNYKDGSETLSLSEIENSGLCSDLSTSALPKRKGHPFGWSFLFCESSTLVRGTLACRGARYRALPVADTARFKRVQRSKSATTAVVSADFGHRKRVSPKLLLYPFRWMFSFYLKDVKGSTLQGFERYAKQYPYCFVAKRCEDGYQNRQIPTSSSARNLRFVASFCSCHSKSTVLIQIQCSFCFYITLIKSQGDVSLRQVRHPRLFL